MTENSIVAWGLGRGGTEQLTKQQEEIWMVSHTYTCIKIYQTIYSEYLKFIIHQLDFKKGIKN